MNEKLISEALSFLKGAKLSEAMSRELQNALYAPVLLENGEKLHELLAEKLQEGRDVIVAGTAGGGKTMLVDQIVSLLKNNDRSVWEIGSSAENSAASVTVIRDLTAIETQLCLNFVTKKSRPPYLIAANEGALMSEDLGEFFLKSIDDLHSLQSGNIPKDQQSAIVVDMAAIDPVQHALPTFLSSELLHAAVIKFENDAGNSDSIRLQAISQLRNPEHAKIISSLVRESLGPGEITFRKLWDFNSDIFIGGRNDNAVPTSPWFWRIFYGESKISSKISEVLKPDFLSLPNVSLFLYKGDIQNLKFGREQSSLWVSPGSFPQNEDYVDNKIQLMKWMKVQFVIIQLLTDVINQSIFVGSRISRYSSLLGKPDSHIDLAYSFNKYFRNVLTQGAKYTGLELWVDLMVERRQDRSHGIVSLGRVPATGLQIVPSRVLANCGDADLLGSRVFFQAKSIDESKSNPSIEVSSALLRVLSSGKTLKKFNRSNDDVELSINNFYFAIANNAALERSDILSVLHIRGNELPTEISWKIDNKFKREVVS